MYGYMSENKILCPGAYRGSTGLDSEAALKNNGNCEFSEASIYKEDIKQTKNKPKGP